MDKSINTNNSSINKIKKNEENEEKSIWDNIIDFFRPEKKKKIEIHNIRGGYIRASQMILKIKFAPYIIEAFFEENE